MKLDLSRDEIATLLNILSPFSNPDSWDDEDLDLLEDRIKRQLESPTKHSSYHSSKIFFPGEWSIETLQNYILENDLKNILVPYELHAYAQDISQQLTVWCNKFPVDFLRDSRHDYMSFTHDVNIYFYKVDSEIRGIRFDAVFL